MGGYIGLSGHGRLLGFLRAAHDGSLSVNHADQSLSEGKR